MVDGLVQGFARDQYAPVRAAFAANLASGVDLGAALCVTVEGETVVDLWGGFADAAGVRPWHRDSIVNVYSTTKTVTALTALLLADRGELDLHSPVARYWPEFAANGKQGVKVSHVMSHSAGLGRRFMSEDGWRRALDLQISGRDLILDMPLRFGMGFALGDCLMPNPNTLYWGGLGGSLAIIDLDARTSFCYVMNQDVRHGHRPARA